jgi:hypothetical protein
MNPMIKKILGALAIKEGIEKIQEIRQPKKKSRLRPLVFLALAGGLGYLYKSGKLQPLIHQAKGLAGNPSGPGTEVQWSNGSSNGSAVPTSSATPTV